MSNADVIYNLLKDKYGLNSASSCGIMANIYYESNFNPTAVGDDGTSYGLCQWHNERNTLLKNTFSKNYDTIDSQIEFLFMELKNSYKTLYNKIIKSSDDSEGAYNIASLFCEKYEIPENKEEKAKVRGEYAIKLFNAINKSALRYTNEELADLVIKGSFGNDPERREKIESMGYDYESVRALVNEKLGVKKEVNTPTNNTTKQNYLIQRGDTLTKISNMFGVGIDKIVSDNRGKYPRITRDYIQAGWIISIIK